VLGEWGGVVVARDWMQGRSHDQVGGATRAASRTPTRMSNYAAPCQLAAKRVGHGFFPSQASFSLLFVMLRKGDAP